MATRDELGDEPAAACAAAFGRVAIPRGTIQVPVMTVSQAATAMAVTPI